jgi:hypothetical protein
VQLFLISMIRNERDVLPWFLAHAGALFDHGCLVDHLSTDGSSEQMRAFVAARSGWQLRRLDTAAYLQAEVGTELLADAYRAGADAVFFLDADEFVAEHDRPALERAIDRLNAEKKIGHLRWRNCLPEGYDVPFSLDRPAWLCELAEHKKIVLPRWLLERHPDRLRINQGNHTVFIPNGEHYEEAQIGCLYHFPIRSLRQLVQKILTTHLAQSSRADGVVAPHIQALFETLISKELTPELLNAIGADYGAPFVFSTGMSESALRARGYRVEVPRVSRLKVG